MTYINGGTFKGRHYSAMYDFNSANNNVYDKEQDLIGLIGIEETLDGELLGEAMVWFKGDNVDNLTFVKGETYYSNLDLTESELRTLFKEELIKKLESVDEEVQV